MEEPYVEAIEDGKIVRVPERYAISEGLMIIKKASSIEIQESIQNLSLQKNKGRMEKETRRPIGDKIYSPTDWKEKQVISELVENFHWVIKTERRKRGMTKTQLAKLLNEPEESIQTLEFGRIPKNDFVLINKVQKLLGINLRKDGKDFDTSVKDMIQKQDSKVQPSKKDHGEKHHSEQPVLDDIEIIDLD